MTAQGGLDLSPGVAGPATSVYTKHAAPADEAATENGLRTILQGLASLAGAAGIALLVPLAILLIGLPIALVIRGIAEAIGWLLPLIVG